ncbi:MAG: pilus assembly protein TadC, partial [Saccharomonospora viridis]
AELARAACRTASSGSALAAQAFALAERIRNAATDRVEARAQRASVLVAGPLGLCFLPAFLCLGVIPVVLGLADHLTVTP